MKSKVILLASIVVLVPLLGYAGEENLKSLASLERKSKIDTTNVFSYAGKNFVCVIANQCIEIKLYNDGFNIAKSSLEKMWLQNKVNGVKNQELSILLDKIKKEVSASNFVNIKNDFNKIIFNGNAEFMKIYIDDQGLNCDIDRNKLLDCGVSSEFAAPLIHGCEKQNANLNKSSRGTTLNEAQAEIASVNDFQRMSENNDNEQDLINKVTELQKSIIPLFHVNDVKRDFMQHGKSFFYVNDSYDSIEIDDAGNILANPKEITSLERNNILEPVLVHEIFHFILRDKDSAILGRSLLPKTDEESDFSKVINNLGYITELGENRVSGMATSGDEMITDLITAFYISEKYGNDAIINYADYVISKSKDTKRNALLNYLKTDFIKRTYTYNDYINYVGSLIANQNSSHVNRKYSINCKAVSLIDDKNKQNQLKKLDNIISAGVPSGANLYGRLLGTLR